MLKKHLQKLDISRLKNNLSIKYIFKHSNFKNRNLLLLVLLIFTFSGSFCLKAENTDNIRLNTAIRMQEKIVTDTIEKKVSSLVSEKFFTLKVKINGRLIEGKNLDSIKVSSSCNCSSLVDNLIIEEMNIYLIIKSYKSVTEDDIEYIQKVIPIISDFDGSRGDTFVIEFLDTIEN